MTLSPTSRRLRWLAPAGVAALVAGAAFTSNATSASGAPKLPARTAAELLASIQDANPAGLSGTIVTTAKLGLPDLPVGEGSGGATLSLQSLATGSHTFRVWYAGESRQRVAVLGQLSESDVVHNGSDLWTYTSSTRRVTHSTIRQPDDIRGKAKAAIGSTPKELAERTLAALDPSTSVTVDSTARVAGRATYQLLVEPRDARSLIGSIRIATDAETAVPLRVQVFARGADAPALEAGFTDVSFVVPDASIFTFVPPAGSEVVEEDLGATMLDRGRGFAGPPVDGSGEVRIRVEEQSADAVGGNTHGSDKLLGKGWTAVLALPASAAYEGAGGDLLQRMATPVAGGRIITSPLLTVFISDSGPMYVGSVTPEALQTVAATGRAL